MISPQFCRAMAVYNRTMNRKLYALCAGLSDEARREDRGAPFRSIHGTLNHLLLGDSVWMGRFQGPPFLVGSLAQELHADFGALQAAREAMDERIEGWAAQSTGPALAGELRYTGIAPPEPRV